MMPKTLGSGILTARVATVSSSLRNRANVFQLQTMQMSESASGGGAGSIDLEDELDDGMFTKDRRYFLPQKQKMPEAAKKSRYMPVSYEKKGALRRSLLDKFKSNKFSITKDSPDLEHGMPDFGMLDDLREMNEDASDMELDDFHDENELKLDELGYVRHIVTMDQVQKVTKQGRTMSFRALVVVGNQRGCAGYAIGKASSTADAILRGTKHAMRSLTFVDLYEHRTLYHEVRGKWNSSTLFLRPAPFDKGLTVSDTVACVMNCFGITDIVSKCHGQRNPFTVVKATFDALSKHETAEQIAMRTGHSLVDIRNLARTRNL